MCISDIVVCTETCANKYHHMHKDTVHVNPILLFDMHFVTWKVTVVVAEVLWTLC